MPVIVCPEGCECGRHRPRTAEQRARAAANLSTWNRTPEARARSSARITARITAAPLVGPANPRWSGDEVGKQGAHDRVKALRGPASDRLCVECGHPADHWSLTTRPPGTWSPNPEDYDPRCASCHKLFDNEWCSREED